MENISLVESQQIDDKIQIIIRQTEYSEEEAREKLTQFNFNEISVIKDYLGITEKKTSAPIKSINQAIYKQLRNYLDKPVKKYNELCDNSKATK